MALFETSSQFKRWLLQVEALESRRRTAHDKSSQSLVNPMSASRQAGSRPIFDFKECYTIYNAYLRALLALCKQLQMPHTVLNSAAEFFKRVYIDRTVMDLHPEHAMRACCFLACKVDNYRGPANMFVQVSKHTTTEIEEPKFSFANAMPNAIKALQVSYQPLELNIHLPQDDVLKRAELMLLEVIGFDLHVYSTRRVASAMISDFCEEMKSKASVPSTLVPHDATSNLKATPKLQLKINPVLADEFGVKLRDVVEALVDETLPGDASLLLPPIHIAERCLNYGLFGKLIDQFNQSASRPDPLISKFAPILEHSARELTVNTYTACFSKQKVKAIAMRNCEALLLPPLPPQAEMQRCIRRHLFPPLSLDALRQTKDLMLRWESTRNPEFDRDSDYYAQDHEDHEDCYKAKKIRLREEANQRSSMDAMADGLMPQPHDADDDLDNFLRINPNF